MSIPGDTLTSRGRVTVVRMLAREARVTCDVWVENQRGEVITHGNATVSLARRPRKAKGGRDEREK